MNWRRMAIFLGLNVLVSAITTLVVLNMWDAGRATTRMTIPTAIPTTAAFATVAARPITATVSLPTLTPAPPTPTSGPRNYVVKSGDTLTAIARDFDVSVEAILAANNLVNGDLLSVGQSLIIPASGTVLATATAATTSAATSVPTPTVIRPRPVTTATQSATQSSTVTTEAFVTIREIINTGNLPAEAIIVSNLGARLNLAGWSIADGDGNKFTFPDLTLLQNAEVKVHTRSGTNTTTDLFWGQSTTRWGVRGTVAYLRDPAGKLIGTYRVP